MLLDGKVALVTGASRGIGRAVAIELAKEGATVAINYAGNVVAAEEVKNIITDMGGKAMIVQADVSDEQAASEMVEKVIAEFGQIDILVNNAGVMGRFGIANADEEMFQSVIDTNLKGPFFLSGIVGKYMRDNGIKGNILNICSSSSIRPANSVYGISKWGLRGFTLGLAKSLLPYGITVNGLAPGPTATPMILKDPKKGISRQGLMERQILPEEIANMAVVLVSGIGKTIIGDVIYMTTGCGVITYDDIPCEF